MKPFAPFQLVVEPTNRCQFSCIHCFRVNNVAETPDLPLVLYEKLLRESLSYRVPYVGLTGGEPTLHPEFDVLLALTAQYDYAYTLVTNGWTFEQVYPLLRCYRKYINTIFFSLDGAEEETHDTIRQQSGSYRRVLQACMLCYHQQIPFKLSMVLHKMNIKEIDAVIDLATKLGADAVHLSIAQLTPMLVSNALALSPSERRQLQEKLLELEDSAPIEVKLGFDCYIENPCFCCRNLQMSTLTIDYLGQARFCCQLLRTPYEIQNERLDIIGSLEKSSVWELHRKLIGKIAKFQQDKIRRIEQNVLTENDYFPCYYCANYFHKLEWLRNFSDSPWSTP